LRPPRAEEKSRLLLAALCSLGAITALATPASGSSPQSGKKQPPQVFPVRGPHSTRGPIGDFGAPRDGGRTHEGFDIVAACGTPLVSARAGRVIWNRYDAVLYGNEVLIHARGTDRNYRYAHLRQRAIVAAGETVKTGQRIGAVGETGNARFVGCHLHFEIRIHGQPIDPEPALQKWDGWS
jgi:murein DD-endopeptidase MepM/ murein hydrolase activator NlpD